MSKTFLKQEGRGSNNIVQLNQYKNVSTKFHLKELYFYLEKRELWKEGNPEKRITAYRKVRGRFLTICRQQKHLSIVDLAKKLNLSAEKLYKIERGKKESDNGALFFKICQTLGVTNEASTFLEKSEEAFNGGIRSFRKNFAHTLKIYGILFADSDKYDEAPSGSILQFLRPPHTKRKRKSKKIETSFLLTLYIY